MADLDVRSGQGRQDRGRRADPDAPRRELVDVAAAAGVLLLASGAVLAGAPATVRTTGLVLALASLTAVSGRRGMWRAPEKLVVALGGALAGLVLLGAALALSPVGVSREAWAGALAAGGAAVLLVAAQRPVVMPLPRVRPSALVWGALATAVAVGALTVAVRGSELTDTTPLQMWLDEGTPGEVAVELRAPGPAGPYDLWLEPVGGTPVLVSSSLNLPGDRAVRILLPGDPTERAQVVLRAPGSDEDVRTVIIDGS